MSVVDPFPLLIGQWPFSQTGAGPDSPPRIFVSIPSYRDAETQWTVKDLFAKARNPEHVFVGICWQFDAEHDAHCFVEPYPRPEQVRAIDVPSSQTQGANWARAQALSLWQDEQYVLMIDAHMRFEQDWDQMLLDMLQQCPSEAAVLTTFPTNYTPPDDCDRYGVKRMAFREFTAPENDAPSKLRYRSFRIPPHLMPSAPFAAASVAHGFMFASAKLFQTVPIDPHIYFFGDEMTFAARAWTHGWDFYSPHRPVVFHLWDRSTRPRHVQDQPRDARQLRRRSAARVAHLVGIEECKDPHALIDIESYGLGTARTLADYQQFSGVDFGKRALAPHSLAGRFDDAFVRPISPPGSLRRILVAIRSYRDVETQWTIKNLFATASRPERINVGVCWQVEPGEDAECFKEPYPYPDQIRVVGTLASETGGACWAHAQALALADGEDYVLLIDAHMRFVAGWDELLINLIESAEDDKAVLTAWLPGYLPPDVMRPPPRGHVRQIAVKRFSAPDHPSILHLKGVSTSQERRDALNATPFLIGNFIFARATTFDEVPIDPHIRLYGEEISLSARLWTHGYTLYEPGVTVAYHYWKPREIAARDTYKRRSSSGTIANNQRVRHLLRLETSPDPAALIELDRYSLGRARSVQSLWQFAGVDPSTGVVSENAANARWSLFGAQPPDATTTQLHHAQLL